MRPRTDVTADTPVDLPSADLAGQADTPLATGRPRRRLQALSLRVAAGLAILAAWQLCVSAFAPSYIATPIDTAKRIPTVFSDSQFTSDVQTPLTAIIEGLFIAIVIGTIVGLAMGRLPDVNRVLGMYVGAFYAAPLIAVVPLLTVWFGYTSRARLAVIVLEAVLPIIYNVAEGARLVPATFLDITRIHHAPWWRVWSGVVLPNTVPYALAGLPLPFPGNANPQALVAGQLKQSVLHLNEFVDVQSQGKKLTTVLKMSQAVPDTMYEMFGTTKGELAKKRPAFVKLIAAQIATIAWMNDSKNADAVAQYATVTGDKKKDLLTAMAQYRAIDFWSSADAAMPRKNVTNSIQGQVASGNVKAAKAPKYADIVDLSVYTDARKLVSKTGG